MARAIGIDLGTTSCVVAVVQGGAPIIIPNQEGSRLTPCVVSFTNDGEIVVGQAAKPQAITDPESTVFAIKRFTGRRYDDVLQESKRVPYKVVRGENADARVEIRGTPYSPPEISRMILRKLKDAATAYLGENVTQAVIAVPAYFNDSQRQATRDAGQIAGLEVLRIIDEPAAVILAYGMNKKEQTVAVYHLGGGTFDISIVEVGESGAFKVLATDGDTDLGGDDFDQTVMDWIAGEFKREHGRDLAKDRLALQRLDETAEKAKRELSTTYETEIDLSAITADASGPRPMVMTLTRAKFEQLVGDLIDRTSGLCLETMRAAPAFPGGPPMLGPSVANDITEVILVGGQTWMPKVREAVRAVFAYYLEPRTAVNPDEVVAVGAAMHAAGLAE